MQNRKLETRSIAGDVAPDGNQVVGYGAVFNSTTNIADEFTEEVAPYAFNKTIQEADVRITFNHNFDNLLARTGSGTASLEVDENGLKFIADLPNSPMGDNIKELLSRGDLTGSSWMGYVVDHAWTNLDELAHRTIKEIALIEVGPVAIPQYEDATAALRSLEESREADLKSLQEARDELAEGRKKSWVMF